MQHHLRKRENDLFLLLPQTVGPFFNFALTTNNIFGSLGAMALR